MPPPPGMENITTYKGAMDVMLQASKPAPNIPPAFANHPDAPISAAMHNRKQRRIMEARRAAQTRKRKPH